MNPNLQRLLAKLTLDEKVAQLRGMIATELYGPPTPDEPLFSIVPERLDDIRPHGVGHLSMAWFLGTDVTDFRARVDKIQAAIRERSPLGMGALIHFEAISGVVQEAAPQFPTAWAQACTWAPELTRAQAEVNADFVRLLGGHQVFSPVMDLARDARWGRVHETYGEDPELAAQFSVAFTKGIQGESNDSGVAATGKHFLGYGASEGGLNQAITQLGRRALVDDYAEPFRRAIAEAGLATVMNSYNEIDGVPSAADRWLLTELLREQLGFDGLVVSDYESIVMLQTVYHTAASAEQAGAQALAAGLDVDLPAGKNFESLADEVRAGRLDEAVVDLAVLRVLQAKERAGLIPSLAPSGARPPAPAAADVADPAVLRTQIAERALVLLKNDGVLPLTPGAQRVLVVGPAANELRIHFGAYTSVTNMEMQAGIRALRSGQVPGISAEEAIFTDIFQARMPGIEPMFEAGVARIHPEMPTLLAALTAQDSRVRFADFGSFLGAPEQFDHAGLAAAVADADLVIAALGERTGWVGNNTAGEGQSTSEPRLTGDQEALVSALAESGKPVVAVVVSGRPLLLSALAESATAILLAPLLGEAAPAAIADALYGDVNPSGALPSTFARSAGQQPMYHGHHMGSGYDHPTGIRHGYNDQVEQAPLYAFGHGLSYTTFAVETVCHTQDIARDGQILVRVRVTNTGTRSGEAVVQLYGRDEAASVVRPVRQLLQFARVTLEAGETTAVDLVAPAERFAFTGVDGRRAVEPGDVTLLVGLASDDIRAELKAVLR
ncbi:MAG: glycoside hydrolase family 3 C-terminal domain-containing protein [Promicromonosporaceae bacterium]|nr:glycoside hydrolase family 3 C-terminal domain-containing protein [Promicromonosporaceae bacterium]